MQQAPEPPRARRRAALHRHHPLFPPEHVLNLQVSAAQETATCRLGMAPLVPLHGIKHGMPRRPHRIGCPPPQRACAGDCWRSASGQTAAAPLASRARRRSSGSPGAARSSAARRRRRRPGQHHRQRHHISVAPETASAWACEGRRRSHPLGVSRREALVMWPPADRQSRRHQHSIEDHHRVSSLSLIRGDLHHVSSPTLPRSFGMASLPDAPHGRWRTGCLSRSPRCCCHRAMS